MESMAELDLSETLDITPEQEHQDTKETLKDSVEQKQQQTFQESSKIEEGLKDNSNDEKGEDVLDANIFSEIFQAHQAKHKHEHEHANVHKQVEKETEEERLIRLVKIDDSDTYPSGKKRGLCLIFENDMFHTGLGLSKRKGSNVDRGLMVDVFSKLQFEVRVFQNLSASEIFDALDEARFEDQANNDMLAVIVLSHGNEGILYGYDRAYPVHKIWEPFTANNCEDLAGKPKLFFFQACQGNQMDSGVVVEQRANTRTETDGFASYRTPLHADFLIAHSTVNGFYSWRNTVQGSWFIQVLGASLLVNSYKQDLMTILTKVARVVAREYESNSSNKDFNAKKQIPFIYSTLTNKLLFKHK